MPDPSATLLPTGGSCRARRATPSPRRASSTGPRPAWITRGAVVLDAATGQVGEVQHVGPPYATGPAAKKDRETVWLRPCHGGREWEATIADLSPTESGLQGAA
jgi:hypothetical protein